MDEVISIVHQAGETQKHIRTVGTLHTINDQICTNGTIIKTEGLNKIVGLEEDEVDHHLRVVAEPGITLGELDEYLDKHGLSLGYPHVGFRKVSLGGVIATGSHGSSPRHAASISALVDSITLVDSSGAVREFNIHNTLDRPELMKALRTHLGVFGVVVQIKLRIQPQFNLHVRTEFGPDSSLFLSQGLVNHLLPCDFGELLWFPNVKKVVQYCANETTEDGNAGAENSFQRRVLFY